MNFVIQREPLLEALQKVQSVVEKKNTVPILGNILCAIQNETLSLCATDLEVGIKVVIPVEGGQDGKITLSAKHFLDIVKELPDKPLNITRKDNNWIEIVCGKSRFNIVSLSAEEYPVLPTFEDKSYFEVRMNALAEMVSKTEFAVSTDPTRYHLNGVFFEHLQNGVMRMTATDGHRLSFVDSEIFLRMPELKRGIIIPKKGLSEIKKLMLPGEETMGLAFERGYIFARSRDTYLFVRLIDGEYPDYRVVIPRNTDRSMRMDRAAFSSALKRVSLLAHEKSRGVKLALQEGSLTLSSSNPDMGEAREEMEVEYSGEPMDIGFNSRYLLDCLNVMGSGQLELQFKDRLSPGIIKGLDSQNHTYVIMPMRI